MAFFVDRACWFLVIEMSRNSKDGYDLDAVDTLDDDGIYVEPDVKHSIVNYLNSMGLNKKTKIKVSELRNIIRESVGHIPLKCPDCGSNDIQLWSISGNVKNPDWVECKKCGASGRIENYEIVEASNTMGRMNFMNTSDDEHQEDVPLEEFADWAQGFQDNYDEQKYEILARQVYDSWPHHDPDVDWLKVVDIYMKNRVKNLHLEFDKNKLYEKLLSYVENGYNGKIPPVISMTRSNYGQGLK